MWQSSVWQLIRMHYGATFSQNATNPLQSTVANGIISCTIIEHNALSNAFCDNTDETDFTWSRDCCCNFCALGSTAYSGSTLFLFHKPTCALRVSNFWNSSGCCSCTCFKKFEELVILPNIKQFGQNLPPAVNFFTAGLVLFFEGFL